jgi:hypothetical protein
MFYNMLRGLNVATKEPSQQLDPRAVSASDMARLLSAAGNRKITPEQVQADIDAGAPVNSNGMLNLVTYAAWLLREVQSR